jgi:hypothetical protein
MRTAKRPIHLERLKNPEVWAEWRQVCNRSHEECVDCAWEFAMPPVCTGHESGPVRCKQFVLKGREGS